PAQLVLPPSPTRRRGHGAFDGHLSGRAIRRRMPPRRRGAVLRGADHLAKHQRRALRVRPPHLGLPRPAPPHAPRRHLRGRQAVPAAVPRDRPVSGRLRPMKATRASRNFRLDPLSRPPPARVPSRFEESLTFGWVSYLFLFLRYFDAWKARDGSRGP